MPPAELHGDAGAEVLARRIVLLLASNPSAEDIDMVLFSLDNVSRQLAGRTPLSPHAHHAGTSRSVCRTSRAPTLGRFARPCASARPCHSSWAWLVVIPPRSMIFSAMRNL